MNFCGVAGTSPASRGGGVSLSTNLFPILVSKKISPIPTIREML